MKIVKLTLAVTIYLALLCAIYLLHINYFRVNVVFYAAIFDSIIATFLLGIIIHMLKLFKVFNGFEKLTIVILCALIGYIFAISVPTVIDRSLSFYILEKIHQRGGGIKSDAIEQVFTNEYMNEHRLVDVRLTEQLESGTITIINNCVKLTRKGELVAEFSRYFRLNFLPKKRLLMGEYTDELTDPFRKSIRYKDYGCKD